MTGNHVNLQKSKPSLIALAFALAAAIAAPATSASAQGISGGTSANPQSADSSGEAIVVTGSRLARSGFQAPTPVTVLSGEQLQKVGDTNLATSLNRLPSFRAQTTPLTQGYTQAALGSQILDLRGLGASRTLVMVDGRRHVATTTQGTFDLSMIPSSIIERAEVVSGGASAAYGSDAVAGVVNLIVNNSLKRREGAVAIRPLPNRR